MNASRRALGSLPIIDLTPFTTNGTEAARRRTAEDLRCACIDIGFFYLSGHGLSRDRLQQVLDIGMRFFALPLEEKMKLHQSKSAGRHGYVGTGDIRENDDDSSDVRERFRMTREPIPGEPAMGQEAWADPV